MRIIYMNVRLRTFTRDSLTSCACVVRDPVQSHHIDAHNVLSFRDRCDNVRTRTFQRGSSVATPIFYRSQLFAPLSPESPSFLVDILHPNGDVDSGEWNAHVTVYNMTYRCDLESRWICHLKELLSTKARADSLPTTTTPPPTPAATSGSETEPSLFKVRILMCSMTTCF